MLEKALQEGAQREKALRAWIASGKAPSKDLRLLKLCLAQGVFYSYSEKSEFGTLHYNGTYWHPNGPGKKQEYLNSQCRVLEW